jgi:hypothetical protein
MTVVEAEPACSAYETGECGWLAFVLRRCFLSSFQNFQRTQSKKATARMGGISQIASG